MLAVAAIFMFSLALRLVVSWRNYGDLDHNAPGTWAAIAIDARNGLFYRPIVSSVGYGGTRYAPVIVVIYAGLLRLGLDPFTSGFILGLAATASVVSGLFLLMRQLRTPPAVAAPLAVFALAAACIRLNILGIRGDILPLGLTLWGFIFIVRFDHLSKTPGRHWGLLIAAALFSLAAATKITSVYGIATAALWLLIRGQFRPAVLLSVAWGILMLIFVLATQWASGGRAIAIFRLCAGGGGGLRQILHGPHDLLSDAIEHDHVLVTFWLIVLCSLHSIGNGLLCRGFSLLSPPLERPSSTDPPAPSSITWPT